MSNEINWNQKILCQKNEDYNFSVYRIIQDNCQLIFTEGLANYQQSVDDSNKSLEKIELYFCLPDYWDLEKKPWPLYWLNRIAQVPQKNKTWFGVGDTLPAGNPPKALDEKLLAEYFILLEPIFLKEELANNSNFKWLAVVPIFKKEFEFKTQNSAIPLIKKFELNSITEMVDVFRLPVGRKKFMGIF